MGRVDRAWNYVREEALEALEELQGGEEEGSERD